MRFRRVLVLLFSVCLLTFATAGVAWAHVVVSPKEAPANNYQKFVVSVPTEKDIPTTKVRVEVPEGFTVTGVEPVPGWQYEFEKDGGTIKAITWSGGKIEPEEFQEFALQAKTPKDQGEFPWNAYQTYEDGSVVEWTGPSGAEDPASVVQVVAGGTHADEHGGEAHEEHGSQPEAGGGTTQGGGEHLPDSGGVASPAIFSGIGAVGMALAMALTVLVRRGLRAVLHRRG